MKQLYFLLFLTLSLSACKSTYRPRYYEMVLFKEKSMDLEIKMDDQPVHEALRNDTLTYVTISTATADSILIYNYGNKNILKSTDPQISLLTWGQKARNSHKKLYFYQNNKITDSLSVSFHPQNEVRINKDSYYLNAAYYKYLVETVSGQNNIFNLADLLKDKLGDYPIELEMLYKMRYGRVENPAPMILRAEIRIGNKHHDDVAGSVFKVDYTYDADHKVRKVSKINKNDLEATPEFEKTWIKKQGNFDVYTINRYSDNFQNTDTVYRDELGQKDSTKTEWLQLAINKTSTSVCYPVFRKIQLLPDFVIKATEMKNYLHF
ncbi:hypothetical protein [Pedobacter caeni]|nr:hypothetical protein [Pedobacter caeni]